jgi:hypothetical protein
MEQKPIDKKEEDNKNEDNKNNGEINSSKLQLKIEEKKKKNSVIKRINNIDLDKIYNITIEDKQKKENLVNSILNKETKVKEIFQFINSPISNRNKKNKFNSKEKNEKFLNENSNNLDSNRKKYLSISPDSETKKKNKDKYRELLEQISKIDKLNDKRKKKFIPFSKHEYKNLSLSQSIPNIFRKKNNFSSPSSSFLDYNFSPKNNSKNYPNLKKMLKINNFNNFSLKNSKNIFLKFNSSRNKDINKINFNENYLGNYYKKELKNFTIMLKTGNNSKNYNSPLLNNNFLNSESTKKFEKKKCLDKLKNW